MAIVVCSRSSIRTISSSIRDAAAIARSNTGSAFVAGPPASTARTARATTYRRMRHALLDAEQRRRRRVLGRELVRLAGAADASVARRVARQVVGDLDQVGRCRAGQRQPSSHAGKRLLRLGFPWLARASHLPGDIDRLGAVTLHGRDLCKGAGRVEERRGQTLAPTGVLHHRHRIHLDLDPVVDQTVDPDERAGRWVLVGHRAAPDLARQIDRLHASPTS